MWSSTSKKNVRKLQLAQTYACRIVAGLRKYNHVSEALKSLKWLHVRDKLLFNDLVMVYKCLKNLTPGYLHGRFQYRAKTYQRVTRQSNDLTLPWYRLATGQKTFTNRGAKLYNSILVHFSTRKTLLYRRNKTHWLTARHFWVLNVQFQSATVKQQPFKNRFFNGTSRIWNALAADLWLSVACSLSSFKAVLYGYYYKQALVASYIPDDTRSFKIICLTCNAALKLGRNITCCF